MKLILTSLILVIVGCASNSKSFNTDSIPKNEGIFYGNIKFVMNGKDVTNTCYFQTLDEEENRVHYSLDKSGFFVGKANKGKNHLKMFSCREGIQTYIYRAKNKNVFFENIGNGSKTYFGDITVYWVPEELYSGWTNFIPFVAGAKAAMGSEEAKTLVFVIENNKKTEIEFEKKVKTEKKIKNQVAVLQVPKGQAVNKKQAKIILAEMKKAKNIKK